MDKYCIEIEEFQKEILKFIYTEEYKKILASMINGDDRKFQMGFIQGLCWASILASTISQYIIKGEDIDDSNREARAGVEDSSSTT